MKKRYAIALCAVVGIASWFAGARRARAPEPARLDGNLSAETTFAYGHYVSSETVGIYYVPFTWTNSVYYLTVPTGTPCMTFTAGPGTIPNGTVIHNGSYTRCSTY
jgi:hypothetical protein